MPKKYAERTKLLRVIDANLNRASEAARVVEDYARFVLDHAGLANSVKSLRHRLREAADALGLKLSDLLSARDTEHDVGTELVGARERERSDMHAVLRANFQRLQQSLRVLEEYSKLAGAPDRGFAAEQLSGRKGSSGDIPKSAQPGSTLSSLVSASRANPFESLRYDSYTIEKLFASPPPRPASLDDRPLMVLVGTSYTPRGTRAEVVRLARAVLKGGGRLIELREKNMPDREYLALARELRELTRRAQGILIVNDRADVARASQADGVHLGLDDLPAEDARRILGPSKLVGLTAHSVAELRDAESRGADYIGVGTMFRSPTKPKLKVTGPAELVPATLKCSVPCYAIGGITRANLDVLLALGATRVAVGAAIACSRDVTRETRWFVRKLDQAGCRRQS